MQFPYLAPVTRRPSRGAYGCIVSFDAPSSPPAAYPLVPLFASTPSPLCHPWEPSSCASCSCSTVSNASSSPCSIYRASAAAGAHRALRPHRLGTPHRALAASTAAARGLFALALPAPSSSPCSIVLNLAHQLQQHCSGTPGSAPLSYTCHTSLAAIAAAARLRGPSWLHVVRLLQQ